jgi:hypothetical protein
MRAIVTGRLGAPNVSSTSERMLRNTKLLYSYITRKGQNFSAQLEIYRSIAP